MNPIIEKALYQLQKANYAGYFDELDKITISIDLMPAYAELKGKFIVGSYPYNFPAMLDVFAKQVDKNLSDSPTKQEQLNNTNNHANTQGNGNTIIQGVNNSTIHVGNVSVDNANKASNMLKVLMLTANPAGTTELELHAELGRMATQLGNAENVKLKALHSTNSVGLMGKTLDEKPDILHFSGHGKEEGIILQNENSNGYDVVSADQLDALFNYFCEVEGLTFQAVILNACHAENQAKAINKYVKYVIGTTKAIKDDHANAFTTGFYLKLAKDTRNIYKAFEAGKVQAVLKGATREDFILLENTDL